MRMLLCALIFLASQSQAFESHYVVNQDLNKGQLEMNFHKVQQEFETKGYSTADQGKENLSALEFSYSHSLDEVSAVGASTSFISRSYHSDVSDASNSASGLSDLELFVKSGSVFKPLTLIYGASANLSAIANKPYLSKTDSNRNNGNNFSGVNSLSPFVGIESYFGQIAVGGRFTLETYAAQNIGSASDASYSASPATAILRTEGFVEFPIFKKVDLGVNIAAGNNGIGLGTYLDRGDEYLGRVYGQYKFDKETAILAAISSEGKIVPVQRYSTDLTLGLRRSL